MNCYKVQENVKFMLLFYFVFTTKLNFVSEQNVVLWYISEFILLKTWLPVHSYNLFSIYIKVNYDKHMFRLLNSYSSGHHSIDKTQH